MDHPPVFWDTAAFLALLNTRDQLHQPAVVISQRLAIERRPMLTTSAVLVETANSLSKVSSRELAWRLMNSIQQSAESGAAEWIYVDHGLWQRGWQLYRQRLDKEWSLTDCFSFIVMQDYHILEAFTSDHHFEQAGFSRLLLPV